MNQETNIVGIQNINIEGNAIEKLLSAIIPDFVREAGGILSDTVRGWRYKNQIKILQKTQEYCSKHSVQPQKVPLKFAVQLVENASLEEDESMQNRWAALLANAAMGQKEVQSNFVEILKQLDPLKALILDKIYEDLYSKENDPQKRKLLQISKKEIEKIFHLTEIEADVIIEDLFRLNLCQAPGSRGASMGSYPFALRTTDVFELTVLGFSFIKSCRFR